MENTSNFLLTKFFLIREFIMVASNRGFAPTNKTKSESSIPTIEVLKR